MTREAMVKQRQEIEAWLSEHVKNYVARVCKVSDNYALNKSVVEHVLFWS